MKSRDEVYADVTATLGFVPDFIQLLPDAALHGEWEAFKRSTLEPGPIPEKYLALIDLAVAAAISCRYCTYFDTEFARSAGASDAEIRTAIYVAMSTSGWSRHLYGNQVDFEAFKGDVDRMIEHLRGQTAG